MNWNINYHISQPGEDVNRSATPLITLHQNKWGMYYKTCPLLYSQRTEDESKTWTNPESAPTGQTFESNMSRTWRWLCPWRRWQNMQIEMRAVWLASEETDGRVFVFSRQCVTTSTDQTSKSVPALFVERVKTVQQQSCEGDIRYQQHLPVVTTQWRRLTQKKNWAEGRRKLWLLSEPPGTWKDNVPTQCTTGQQRRAHWFFCNNNPSWNSLTQQTNPF